MLTFADLLKLLVVVHCNAGLSLSDGIQKSDGCSQSK